MLCDFNSGVRVVSFVNLVSRAAITPMMLRKSTGFLV